MDTTEETKTFVRVLTPEEASEFRGVKTNVIKTLRMGKIRCPRTGCNSSFVYATPSKAWLQQEESEINGNTATEVMVYRCRACGRGFNDLTKAGMMTGSKLPPPGPERVEYLSNLLKKAGMK